MLTKCKGVDIGLGRGILDIIIKAQTTKLKINTLDLKIYELVCYLGTTSSHALVAPVFMCGAKD